MLQETLLRGLNIGAQNVAPPSFVCAVNYERQVLEQCQEEGVEPLRIILEPCPRNTAPVAAIVALEIQKIDPDGLILLLPADHHIEDVQGFWDAVNAGKQTCQNGQLTTFGIQPTRPETGYGYIKAGQSLDERTVKVDAFVEKPDGETAQAYVHSGDYFWNAGIFLFSPQTMIDAAKSHASDILTVCEAALRRSVRKGVSVFLDPASFSDCRDDSIDYAIMEKASNVSMVCPVDIGWNDIGSWEAIREHMQALPGQPLHCGNVIAIDCKGSYLRSEGPLIAAIGIEDLIVVAMPDAILITRSDTTQDVKTIVQKLKASNRKDLL